MKFSFILLFVSIIQLMAIDVTGQNAVIQVSAGKTSVGKLLNEIEKQTNYLIIYSNREVDTEKEIDLVSNTGTVAEYLKDVFAETDIHPVFENDYIVLSKKLVNLSAVLQSITVTGTVTDESGDPMPGVNVVVKETTTGVVTGSDGKYNISIPDRNAVLVFSFMGYLAQEIAVGDKTNINIVLEEESKEIEEVIVVGYGVQKKETMTGSVVAVKGSEIVKSPTVNVASSLAGKLPGVIINTRTGEPGRDDPSVYVRGRSTTGNTGALVIIDGVERGGMGRLNPNDIESISVLKDASAAIYGSRAANGVILITTKRGSSGKPIIDFSSENN